MPKRAAATRTKTRATKPEPVADGAGPREHLADITVPSGELAIVDIGLFGFLPREALAPAIVRARVPADRALAVRGVRVGGTGRLAALWDHVAIELAAGETAHAHKLGEAGVDFERLLLIDHGALDHWTHEDSLDGLADFVFWGRDAAELARIMSAPAAFDEAGETLAGDRGEHAGRTIEGHGWLGVPTAEAEARADRAARIKKENHFLITTDLRPHSHYHGALAAARASRTRAGTIEVGGTTACLLFTSWGDGLFPVYLDVDADDQPVQVRIQLATPAAQAAYRARALAGRR